MIGQSFHHEASDVPNIIFFGVGHKTHFFYRILDSKKTSHFQFSVPGLREIHRNLKQQKNFNSHNGFFRKSPFCTFSCINPGFGGPWDVLWIFFLIVIFIMLCMTGLSSLWTWSSVRHVIGTRPSDSIDLMDGGYWLWSVINSLVINRFF